MTAAISRPLDALLCPRSVAVLGASRRRGTIGGEIFHNLLACAFEGPVYPVNPRASVVQSVRAYAAITDIPEPVDLAVVAVPADQVRAAIEACANKGVRGLVVVSAGFAETGEAGRARQDELRALARAAGMRMVGPNCLGLLSTDPAISLNATFAPTWPPAGNVAFSSQSGALGLAILDLARDLGIGISEFVSVGNKADVSGNDLLEHWEHDPRTDVILLYLESFGNPRRFLEIARRVSRRKPIVAVKSGRTEAGARAASSHTGALAGTEVAVDALLGQAGVIRTDTIEELFDVAMLLAHQRPPRGNRVAILTNAGGPGIMASDACETHGLVVPPLAEATVRALRDLLPPTASLRNPVDMIASAPAATYERALQVVLGDPGVDAVLVLFVPPIVTEARAVAEAIRHAGAEAEKPIVACFMGSHGVPAGISSLREAGFASYAFPEAAAIALGRAARYGAWRARPEAVVPEPAGMDPALARRVLLEWGAETGAVPRPAGGWLDPIVVAQILGAYGLRTARATVARNEDEAAEAARALGFPVALKLRSTTITHKSEVGGVVLDLRTVEDVRAAFGALRRRLDQRGRLGEMQGVLVQEMVTGGVETIVGVTSTPGFGPLVGFGIGGVNVEIWRDVVFRMPPLGLQDAHDMLGQIRGRKLLEGFRGAPPADREALVDALLRVSRLALDLPQIEELDLNPLIARPPGEGAVILDARMRVR